MQHICKGFSFGLVSTSQQFQCQQFAKPLCCHARAKLKEDVKSKQVHRQVALHSVPWTVDLMQDFKQVLDHPLGDIVIQAIDDKDDILFCSLLIKRTFAHLPWTGNSRSVVQDIASGKPQSAVLFARLYPKDKSQLNEGQESIVVGFSLLFLGPKNRTWMQDVIPGPLPTSEAYLSSLGVVDEYRRQGIGSTIMKACEDLAVQAGLPAICLHVGEQNQAALELYNKMGYTDFQKCTIVDRVRASASGQMPNFVLRKILK